MEGTAVTVDAHEERLRNEGRVLGRPTPLAPSTALAPALGSRTLGGRPAALAAPAAPLPPSAHALLAELAASGPRTHKALVAGSALPPRTVRYALARLVAVGAVEEVPSLKDARQSWYRVLPGRVLRDTSSGPRTPRGNPLSGEPRSVIRGVA